jgi:hypothetical protein
LSSTIYTKLDELTLQLIDRIATIMENEKVGLTDLLAGLEAEKEAIWQDKQS